MAKAVREAAAKREAAADREAAVEVVQGAVEQAGDEVAAAEAAPTKAIAQLEVEKAVHLVREQQRAGCTHTHR